MSAPSRGGDPQHIGEILAKKYAPPTQAQLDLVESIAAIQETPNAVELAFLVRQLVLCTLPHSDPGDVPVWIRRTGGGALSLQAGWDTDKNRSFGYPYGTIPRLLLYWITKEVQLNKNRDDLTKEQKRTIELGRRLNDFMRTVGLNPDTGGGKRSDVKRLHDQMNRFFNCRISFQKTKNVDDETALRRRNMEVTSNSELWWDRKQPNQGALWKSWLQLGDEFYNALTDLPVPLDMRALKALKRSPLALDLYAWCCFKAYLVVTKKQPPQFVAWSTLAQQLGADYNDPKNFKKNAQAALRKVVGAYPGLKTTPADGGFFLSATRLAVPQKSRAQLAG